MPGELFRSECCGTVFAPGGGPDDIYESDRDHVDAERRGDCPVCGQSEPPMREIRGFEE